MEAVIVISGQAAHWKALEVGSPGVRLPYEGKTRDVGVERHGLVEIDGYGNLCLAWIHLIEQVSPVPGLQCVYRAGNSKGRIDRARISTSVGSYIGNAGVPGARTL